MCQAERVKAATLSSANPTSTRISQATVHEERAMAFCASRYVPLAVARCWNIWECRLAIMHA